MKSQFCFHEGVIALVKFEDQIGLSSDDTQPLGFRATPCAGGGDEVSGIVGTYE